MTDTIHCTSGVHCRTCRDLEGGRAWRESLRTAFELPDDEVDFECPEERGGKPWGYKRTGIPKKNTVNRSSGNPVTGVPPDAEAICRKCHEAKGCPNVRICCGGKVTVNIVVPCPKNYWSSEKEYLDSMFSPTA